MHRAVLLLAVSLALVAGATCRAAKFENGGFESDLGPADSESMWGVHGSVWGGAVVVSATSNGPLARVCSGKRCLEIDPSQSSWDGAWQQLPWPAGKPFLITGSCLIRGGNLPPDCVTVLKAEFYDKDNARLGEVASEDLQNDTKGKWRKITVKGTAPKNTASLRVVIVAGDNAEGAYITDRIFWDDIDLK